MIAVAIEGSRYKTRELTLLIVESSDKFRDDFHAWMRENYTIWERFRQEADKIRATGRDHYSARTLGEYIRHETALREPGDFKLNNNILPDMARLYMILEPRAAAFFELRGRGAHTC